MSGIVARDLTTLVRAEARCLELIVHRAEPEVFRMASPQ